MMKRAVAVFLGGSIVLAAVAALPALAQEGAPGTIVQQGDVNDQFPPEGKNDEIDRVAGGSPRSGFRAPDGVKLVSPGALLFASFDRNFDGKVTRDEIIAGAPGAFAVADKNRDGKVSGFEQSDWAAIVASPNDVLANAMTFDIDLDRAITPAEFTSGLTRIADQLMGVGNNEVAFTELVKPLSQLDRQAERSPDLIDPRAGGGRNISPTGVRSR